MTTDRDAIHRFFRLYEASPVGATPVQPNILLDDETDVKDTVNLTVEVAAEAWKPVRIWSSITSRLHVVWGTAR